MKPEKGTWPWVAASSATAIRAVTIEGFKQGVYEVNLTFSKMNAQSSIPDSVSIQGNSNRIEKNRDLKPMQATTKTFSPINIDGNLTIQFPAPSTLGGIEVIPVNSE